MSRFCHSKKKGTSHEEKRKKIIYFLSSLCLCLPSCSIFFLVKWSLWGYRSGGLLRWYFTYFWLVSFNWWSSYGRTGAKVGWWCRILVSSSALKDNLKLNLRSLLWNWSCISVVKKGTLESVCWFCCCVPVCLYLVCSFAFLAAASCVLSILD